MEITIWKGERSRIISNVVGGIVVSSPGTITTVSCYSDNVPNNITEIVYLDDSAERRCCACLWSTFGLEL